MNKRDRKRYNVSVVNVRVTPELHERMRRLKRANMGMSWGQVARQAFLETCARLERDLGRLEMIQAGRNGVGDA